MNILFSSLGGESIGMVLDDVMLVNVPEPSIIALFGLGLVGLGLMTRRRKQT